MPSFRENPDFPADPDEVRADWERMRASPRPLARPVVVLAGWRAPALRGAGVARLLCEATSQRRSDFLTVTYPLVGDIPTATVRSVRAVMARWPGARPNQSAEIDAVGISMGGLVARLGAAGADPTVPTLTLARLFTLATPHRGAKLARVVALDRAARDMRPGSSFLASLDRSLPHARYELHCYAQLRDWWVGATNSAPQGRSPYWTDARTRSQRLLSHFLINSNLAVLRDIVRRLRGEEPVARATGLPPTD